MRKLPVRRKEPECLSLHIRRFDYHHVGDLNRVRGQPYRRLFRFNGHPHYDFGYLVGSKGLSRSKGLLAAVSRSSLNKIFY